MTDTALAKELGIHRNTVRKYRKAAEAERKEAAKRVLETRVEAAMPNALETMGFVLTTAHEEYKANREAPQGRLALDASVAMLKYLGLGQEADPLDGASDEALLEQVSERLGFRR